MALTKPFKESNSAIKLQCTKKVNLRPERGKPLLP